VADGVNGVVASSADPEAIADAIVRVHEAGFALRESTARWYAENERALSLDASLQTVLDSYAGGGVGRTEGTGAGSPSARP
jgi:glycosyltransferase involved in cell wall biosynthesis